MFAEAVAAVRHERAISNEGRENWILPNKINANRFFWDSHWLEIWKNHLCPSVGPNGESVAMDSGEEGCGDVWLGFRRSPVSRMRKWRLEK
jgi:hypothetical protein